MQPRNGKLFLGIIVGLVVALHAVTAFAWPGQRRSGHRQERTHGYPPHGQVVFSLPGATMKVVWGGRKYFFYDGVFYERDRREYVVIAPPEGAFVRSLPPGYQVIVVNGVSFYLVNETYYQYTPSGFKVIPPPFLPQDVNRTAPLGPQTIAVQAAESAEDVFTVNVPRATGGYIPVVLQRSGKGFIGPQGEFYEDFPSIKHLRVVYAPTAAVGS